MASLAGKKIIITGASNGIGRETAVTMARQGADVLITYNTNKAQADEVIEEIRGMGRTAHAVKVEMRNEADIQALSDFARSAFDRIDALVNNAGIYTYNTALDTTVEQWDLNLDVNLRGTFLASRIIANDILIPQGGGRIINMSSFVGTAPVPNLVAYNVAKAGIVHLTRQLAMEWGRYNIEVVCVSPGYVATAPMLAAIERGDADGPSILRNSPVNRLARPSEVANLFAFLTSDAAGYLSGANIAIDGAYTSGIRFTRLEGGDIVVD